MRSLKEVGAEQVLRKRHNILSLEVLLVDRDDYRFCCQSTSGGTSFCGESMSQYAWAERMNGYLERKLVDE